MDFMSGIIFGFGTLFGFIGAIIALFILIWFLGYVFGLIMVVSFIIFMPFWSIYCYFRGDKNNEDNMTEFYTVMAITAFILLCICEYFSIKAVNMIITLVITSMGYCWIVSTYEKEKSNTCNSINFTYKESAQELIDDVIK